MSEHIDHTGVIEKIEDGKVFVRIMQQSACAGCHARSMCAASDSKEKIIEIADHSNAYSVNEEVIISGQSSLGLQAVFLAFVLPFVLVVGAIVIGTVFNWKETSSALFGLSLLIPYYICLYLFRDTLKRRFIFTIKKLNP